MKDLEIKLLELQRCLLENFDIKLEFIKVDKPLHNIETLHGIGITPIIYEHMATHWINASKEKPHE